MPPPSLARQLFDRVATAAAPVAAIRGLINPADPLFEADWIDFKGEEPARPGRTPDPRQQEKSNRRAWSEYLSAFANTGGGVVLWGIDARKIEVDGRELDFAGAEALVTDPLVLASKLNEWQGQATDPPLSGVQIRPYPVPEDPTRGFVLCFVPEGPFKPYQSLLTDSKQYYHRGGSSNFVMPKATLASLFYPRTRAVFRAVADFDFKWVSGTGQILLRMSLQNDGTATARDVFTRMTWKLPGKKVGMQEVNGSCWSNRDTEFCVQGREPLHPGFRHGVVNANWEIANDRITAIMERGRVFGDVPPCITLAIFAENQEPQTIEVPIDMVELVEKEKLTVEATAAG